MKTWVEPEDLPVPEALLAATGDDHLLAGVLLRRGLGNPEAIPAFLDPNRYMETSPDVLPGIDSAVDHLCAAIKDNHSILIWGDYDVDGQTSTTLLFSGLKAAGAKINYHVPVRASDSHGIQPAALKRHLKANTRLLITCDTGVSEMEGVRVAREAGLDVIITDHHNLPEQLPHANAIVNPKLLPAGHRLSELAGVGVAYKVIQALEQSLNINLSQSTLDLVALGTIADLALLVDDNRYLVQRGLPLLSNTPRVGLQAVYKLNNLHPEAFNEETIAYLLAPRLNAVGRLADANRMVELLTTDDAFKAEIIANEIEGLNARRRQLSDQVLAAAQEQVARDRTLLDQPCLVLSHPTWPGGILGIVASALVENYNRPVILLSNPAGKAARGSARSITGIDITSALEANRDLLLAFGGHPMAAGMSLLPEKLVDFKSAIIKTLSQLTGGAAFEETLILDAELPITALPDHLEESLKRLSPFGPGNPPLTLLSRGMVIESSRAFGRSRDHLRLTIADDSGKTAEITWWRRNSRDLPEGRFDLAYTLKPSSYKGQFELQATWMDAREQTEMIALREQKRNRLVYDHRQDDNPTTTLSSLSTGKSLLVWREGSHASEIDGVTRLELTKAESLAIWTIPPAFTVLQDVLQAVKPREIHLFALEPQGARLESFQTRLAGLIKYAITKKGGQAGLEELSAAMAHQTVTVVAGIEWLRMRGDITYTCTGDVLSFTAGGIREDSALESALDRLLDLLAEAAAFRVYYLHTSKYLLVE